MTQTKSAMPVPYQRGSTLNSTTLYKGGLFSFLVKGEDSGGRDAMIEYRAKPGNEPAPYMNQWEHEAYYVLEGVMEFYCGDSEVMVISAGEMVFLPQGKAHAFSIRSPQVRALILVQAVGEHAVGLVGVASQNENRHLIAMGTPAPVWSCLLMQSTMSLSILAIPSAWVLPTVFASSLQEKMPRNYLITQALSSNRN